MAKKPVLENWEIGDFFGERVVSGYLKGDRVTARLRYWSYGVFGVTRSDAWIDSTWKIGQPAPTAFDGLRP